MSENKRKPSRWYYVLALLIPIFACMGTSVLVYVTVLKLPGALDKLSLNNLTQVVVPGSADIDFQESGAYAVYYEYRSVIDGVSYVREKYPPGINCQLTSKVTGEKVALSPDFIEGNIYSTNNPERSGVLINSISIEKPGVYLFSCQYSDGRTDPQIVLAVGPNIAWEIINTAIKPTAAFICGSFAFVGAIGLSMLIIAIVASKRHKSQG